MDDLNQPCDGGMHQQMAEDCVKVFHSEPYHMHVCMYIYIYIYVYIYTHTYTVYTVKSRFFAQRPTFVFDLLPPGQKGTFQR